MELVQGEKQKELYDAYFSGEYDFVCISSGRQAGKSYGAAHIERDWLLKGEHGTIYWVVAPSMRLTRVVFSRIKSILAASHVNEADLAIHDSNNDISIRYRPRNTRIDFRTAKQQGYLVGETLSGVHIDEAGQITDERIIFEDILPACAVNEACILVTGTPKSAARWYHNIFFSGLPDSSKYRDSGFKVKSFFMDARDNPAPGGLERMFYKYQDMAKRGLYPEDTFKQEWLGQWIDSGGDIFRHLDEAVIMGNRLAERNYDRIEHKNIVHVDIGTTADYAAAAIFADRYIYDYETGKKIIVCKHVEKIPHMDYPRLARRVNQICEDWGDKYPARVSMDGTGLPDATRRVFGESGLRIYWHIWDQENRAEAIAQTQRHLDGLKMALPDNGELLDEMSAVKEKELPSGRRKIEAGEGYHDDMTMAVVQGVFLQSSNYRAIRYRSDKYAERAKYDPRRGNLDQTILPKQKTGVPTMQRRKFGKTGGFFN